MDSTLATHTSGPGSTPIAGRNKRDQFLCSSTLGAHISCKAEVHYTQILRVEEKVHTEDASLNGHAGSEHPQRFTHISIVLPSSEEVYISSSHTYKLHDVVCDLAIQATTINQKSFFNVS